MKRRFNASARSRLAKQFATLTAIEIDTLLKGLDVPSSYKSYRRSIGSGLPARSLKRLIVALNSQFPSLELDFDSHTSEVTDHVVQAQYASDSPADKPVLLIPFRPNPFFSGRTEWLKQLQHSVNAKKARIIAISGLGGIGKTQLALQFAHTFGHSFTHVFWVLGDSAANIRDGYLAIASKLVLTSEPADIASAVDAVRTWLALQSNWLLIFDNADTPRLLESFLPQRSTGLVVLTSRDQNFDVLGQVLTLEVPSFTSQESKDFLRKRTRLPLTSKVEVEAMEELHAELGGLPLALEQAAAFVVEKRLGSFHVYLQEFRHQRLKLLNKQMPVTGNYAYSVATTWLMNFNEVKAMSQAAAELLRVTAFLKDSSPIPYSYIINAAHRLPPALQSLLQSTTQKKLAIAEALAPLARFSLVRVEPEQQTYTMHALVQEIVRDLDEC